MSKLRMLLILVALTLGAAVVAMGLTLARLSQRPELPVLAKVPDFSLVERSGKTVRLADLLGRVWVTDFVFTHCAGPCPLLSRHMARLQELTRDLSGIQLVSMSVDPVRDTPEVLRNYAQRYGASADRWWFLTGEPEQVRKLVQEGFLLPLEGPDQATNDVLHSTRMALVDTSGQIRGYYDMLDEDGRDQLLQDIRWLLEAAQS